MKNIFITTLFLVIALVSSSWSNLLQNGSFELNSVTPPGQNVVLTEENDFWVSSLDAHIAIDDQEAGTFAAEGTNFLVFNQDNQTANGTISQTAPVSVGDVYTLSFKIVNIAGGLNQTNGHFMGYDAVGLRADVIENNTVTHSLSYYPQIVGNWYTQSIQFTSIADSVTISFTDISNETFSIAPGLDDIQLVPEPSTHALLLLGGAASLWALKRRKS
jgi:hypothetical protein